jgi:LacI family sucrose operon transcriptional repressor
MATLKDVAKLAGVATSTVSRIINKKNNFSDEIMRKVTGAMEQLDYHPNEIARSLQNRRSRFIGLIVPSTGNPFFGEITRYVERRAYELEYKVLICNSLHEKEKEKDYINMLKRNQVDGIIMASHIVNINNYLNLSLPLISLDRQLGSRIPYICSDNYEGGVLAAKHLISKGCKRLICISGDRKVPKLSNKRIDSFLDTCKAAGIPCQLFDLPDKFTVDLDGEAPVREILSKNPGCDGIFAGNDLIAMTIIGVSEKLGRKIPEDIKLIGFDDDFFAVILNPPLSTIRQPVEHISMYAVEYLVKMIEGNIVPKRTILPVELIARKSTGICPPSENNRLHDISSIIAE